MIEPEHIFGNYYNITRGKTRAPSYPGSEHYTLGRGVFKNKMRAVRNPLNNTQITNERAGKMVKTTWAFLNFLVKFSLTNSLLCRKINFFKLCGSEKISLGVILH